MVGGIRQRRCMQALKYSRRPASSWPSIYPSQLFLFFYEQFESQAAKCACRWARHGLRNLTRLALGIFPLARESSKRLPAPGALRRNVYRQYEGALKGTPQAFFLT